MITYTNHLANFRNEGEAHAFAEGLEAASHGDVYGVEVIIPYDMPAYVVWIDGANEVKDND